ncbi:histone-like nucleoid-structuring protein Lsr2 [Nonomuraea sp. NPDC050547]|uniref:Lsr2 family DNA-binding protein n=1 Tax=Nonomuraea sp. NPDC050547 TaxID=3364368 RepID=UPI003795F7BF
MSPNGEQLVTDREQAKPLGVGTKRTSSVSREQDRAIRAWAKAHNIPVNERGRIPRAVHDQYKAARIA